MDHRRSAGAAAGSDGKRYDRFAFNMPADFRRHGSVADVMPTREESHYDSRLDAQGGIALADIADLTPLIDGAGRVTASSAGFPGGRSVSAGFFRKAGARGSGAGRETPLETPGDRLGHGCGSNVPEGLRPGMYEIASRSGGLRGWRAGCPSRSWRAKKRPRHRLSLRRSSRCSPRWRAAWTSPRGAAPWTESHAEALVWIESLGGSTGEVAKVNVVTPESGSLEFDGLFAVEPVSLSAGRERSGAGVSEAGGAETTSRSRRNFYCLNSEPPPRRPGPSTGSPNLKRSNDSNPRHSRSGAARRLYEAGPSLPIRARGLLPCYHARHGRMDAGAGLRSGELLGGLPRTHETKRRGRGPAGSDEFRERCGEARKLDGATSRSPGGSGLKIPAADDSQ